MKEYVRKYGKEFLVAIVVTAVMILLRWVLEPWLHKYLLFAPLLCAVAIAVWYGGYRPALTSLAVGILAYAYWFLAPRGRFAIANRDDYVAIAMFLFICAIIIGFGEAMRVARYRAEEQRERLRTTLASIGDAVIATDLGGRVTIMNPVAEFLTGWKFADAAGHPMDAIFRIFNEHTRQPVENPVHKVLKLGRVVGLANHTVLVAKEGTERPIDDSAAPIKCKDGEIVGCVLVFRDVSDRKQAEALLDARVRQQAMVADLSRAALSGGSLQEFMDKVVAAVASVLDIEYCKILEMLPDGERLLLVAGVGWHDGLVGNAYVGADLTSQAGYTLASEEPVVVESDLTAETRFSGPSLLFEHGVKSGMSCVIPGAEGRPFGVLGAHSTRQRQFTPDDVKFLQAVANILGITIERKQGEQALRAADRRKSEFLATLAHELRNPLAPVRNSLQIMRLADSDPTMVEQALDTMDRQISQMVRLVDDLLDVARISRGKIELRKEHVELASIIYQAVEICRPLAEKSMHELSIDLPPDPIYLHADPVRLAQVFSNLLNNACKYSEPASHIRLTAQRQGSDLVVSVTDTGIGIDADVLPRIFDLFTQADPSLERSQGGLGIGLTLVKQLVELHGGTIEATSDGPGSGSEFVVRLPLDVQMREQPLPSPRVPANAGGDTRRILVVDDNKDNARSLAMLLKLTGHETHLAFDGLEAIEAAEQFRPDLVLLDIGLPRLNGFETCRRIREHAWGKDMTLVALTGWGQEDDRRKSKDAGFNHHLVKPVEYNTLLELLGNAMQSFG